MQLMDEVLFESWRDIFERAAALEAEKIRETELEAERTWLDQKKRVADKAKEKEREEREALELLRATDAQVADFDAQLDRYDTQTVHALMENGEALDRVNAELKRMLDDAYVLPDGRRAFKTEDGRQVFDEFGADLTGRVDPAMIEDFRPRWDIFTAGKGEQLKLQAERRDWLRFQAQVDDARERAGKGDMTKKDLDALGADLAASMPAPKRGNDSASWRKDAAAGAEPGSLMTVDSQPVLDDPRRRVAPPTPAPM